VKGAGIAAVPGSTLPVHRVGRRPGAPLSAYWLGQAGFLLETDHLRILIDAYLSDTLAE
jgi:hypothetical protein